MSGERRAVSEEAARRSSASVSFSTRTKQPPYSSAASSDADTIRTTHAPSYKTLTGAEWELRNFVFVLFWWPRSSHISAEHSHDYFISDSEIQRTANLRRFHAKRGMKNTLQVSGLNFIEFGEKHFPSYLSMYLANNSPYKLDIEGTHSASRKMRDRSRYFAAWGGQRWRVGGFSIHLI